MGSVSGHYKQKIKRGRNSGECRVCGSVALSRYRIRRYGKSASQFSISPICSADCANKLLVDMAEEALDRQQKARAESDRRHAEDSKKHFLLAFESISAESPVFESRGLHAGFYFRTPRGTYSVSWDGKRAELNVSLVDVEDARVHVGTLAIEPRAANSIMIGPVLRQKGRLS